MSDDALILRTVEETEPLDNKRGVTYRVQVVGGGGGGGDSHNLGWYATPQALNEAHATATDGDWAIVGSTDTVWVWDSDTSGWVDTDTKGQVTSVNGQTGAVTVQETLVNQTNIKSVDGNSLLGSGNLELSTYLTYPAGWTTNGTTKAFCDGIAADTTATKGKAYLGEVTCSDLPASMVNGEVVVEIMDGTTSANKVIVLTLTSGNTAPYMWKYTYWNGGTNVSGWQTWATSAQGAKADTAVQPADLATVATTGQYSDLSGKPTIPDPTQVSTLPTASADELGNIYQYIGTTDANYTNGYFYKCVSDGQQPATYSWSQVNVQPSPSGYLQNNATGTDSLAILGTATNSNAVSIGKGAATSGGGHNIAIGSGAKASGNRDICIGLEAKDASGNNYDSVVIGGYAATSAGYTVAIGNRQKTTAQYAIQIGAKMATNSDANTVKIANANGNFEIMSADGTIPTARLTKVNSTITLTSAGWSSNTQTVNVTGMTATGVVMVSPDPTDQSAYTSAGILCTAQASGTLTFTCDTVPSADIDVNVVML